MVREDKLKPLLLEHKGPLDQLGRDLIAAANAAGGRDNITVVLFTLEDVDGPGIASHAGTAAGLLDEDTREYDTFQGDARGRSAPGREPPAGLTRAAATRSARPPRPASPGGRPISAEAEYRASGTVALSAVRPRAQPIEEGHPHGPPAAAPRRRRRRLFSPGKLIAFSCVIGLLVAFWLSTRQIFFVGVDESRGNVVTLYKGLPYDLPLGIRLYSPVRHSGVTLQSVPANRRADVHGSHLALQGRRRGSRARAGAGTHRAVSARNRELMALIPASLLLTAGFAAIFIQRSAVLSDVSLTYGGDLPRALLRGSPGDPLHAARTPIRTSSRSSPCSRASGSWSSTGSTRRSRATRPSGS